MVCTNQIVPELRSGKIEINLKENLWTYFQRFFIFRANKSFNKNLIRQWEKEILKRVEVRSQKGASVLQGQDQKEKVAV